MTEAARASQGLIDTSVVIDLDHIDAGQLPGQLAISALTMAELAAGPHATGDTAERARRQDRLQRAEATFDPLPFDGDSARAYGRIYAAIVATGRKARGPRAVDLLIAATALAANLAPLHAQRRRLPRHRTPPEHRRRLTLRIRPNTDVLGSFADDLDEFCSFGRGLDEVAQADHWKFGRRPIGIEVVAGAPQSFPPP